MKIKCYTEGILKPITEFNKDSRMTRGYQGKCRECQAKAFNIWYEKNKAKTQANKRQYKKTNKGKVNAINAKRRAAKLKATPPWLTEDHLVQIEMFYQAAQDLTKELGIEMDVDHMTPLQGELVSGLHVPWNLQVIPSVDNGSKSNRF